MERVDVEKLFEFLVKDYGLKYSFQRFENCFDGGWLVDTYSYYNEKGCFTISNVCQRGEWDHYYADRFSENWESLKQSLFGFC
ncbi:MAG: hypothetical protein FWH03_06230 [Firmicutes bacterium]|nr:hypothetical protein [Bacillota bacterium]